MALTPQQEAFAQAAVKLVNLSAAYRSAYNVQPGTKFTTVGCDASRLAADPEVAARIQYLRDEAAAAVCLPAASQRIKEMREIEAADPREICGIHWVNCRHCHGVMNGFQWRDDMEYAAAYDLAIKAGKLAPPMDGGFGFHGLADPNPNCPRCFGVGDQRPYVNDTRTYSAAVAKLYKGVKIKGNGDMEILFHDQMKVRDMLNRIQGIYKDNTAAQPPVVAADPMAAAKTPEERQVAYLRLMRGT